MASPVLQAILLADQIYVDGSTGKKVIAGTFNRLVSAGFPCQFEMISWAYICLTEVRGAVPISLHYVDLSSNKVLMKMDCTVRCDDPLTSVELITQVPPFPMPHPGIYAFEALHNGVQLGSLRVSVLQLENRPQEPEE